MGEKLLVGTNGTIEDLAIKYDARPTDSVIYNVKTSMSVCDDYCDCDGGVDGDTCDSGVCDIE